MPLSSAAKRYVRFSLAWIAGILLVVTILYQWLVASEINHLRENEKRLVAVAAENLAEFFHQPLSDALVFSYLEGFLEWDKSADKQELKQKVTHSFVNLLAHKRRYDQIRFFR